MVRPITGEQAKKHATISIDPAIWNEFQTLVEAKQPEGDKSASAHVQTLVKKENARLRGSDIPDAVDVDALRREIVVLEKKRDGIRADLSKRGVASAFNDLASAYILDMETYSNVADVIHAVLKDRKVPGSKVQVFLETQDESDLTLFVILAEVYTQIAQLNKKILDAQDKKYGLTLTAGDEKVPPPEQKREEVDEDDEVEEIDDELDSEDEYDAEDELLHDP